MAHSRGVGPNRPREGQRRSRNGETAVEGDGTGQRGEHRGGAFLQASTAGVEAHGGGREQRPPRGHEAGAPKEASGTAVRQPRCGKTSRLVQGGRT
ncbi:hypothetical protein HZB93_00665 [Candidatus Falkowbacteria bacterium]|nr:hypothetical protein [Candidatus Falkowbacteria bacterium]